MRKWKEDFTTEGTEHTEKLKMENGKLKMKDGSNHREHREV